MPAQYKTLISILALVITTTLFFLDTKAGGGAARWVVLLLGPFMVAAIWIFPEPKSKEIRKEAARHR